MRESFKLFLLGFIRNMYICLFAFFLDPFDLFNRFINPNLPSSIKLTKNLDMPSEWFPLALFVLVFIASFRTFHQLRTKDSIYSKERKENVNKLWVKLNYQEKGVLKEILIENGLTQTEIMKFLENKGYKNPEKFFQSMDSQNILERLDFFKGKFTINSIYREYIYKKLLKEKIK